MTENIDYRLKNVNDKLNFEIKELIYRHTEFFNFLGKHIFSDIEEDKENFSFENYSDEEIEKNYLDDLQDAIGNYKHRGGYNKELGE